MTWLLTAAGAALVSVPPNRLVRWVLHRVRASHDAISDGAGRWIGVLERLIIYALVVAGEAGAAALVVTAKSILRFPEITGSEPHLNAEYVLIGSLTSWLVAIVGGLLVRHAIGLV